MNQRVCALLITLVGYVGCRSPKVEHDAATAVVTSAAPVAVDPCAASCSEGVCDACPTEDIALAGKEMTPTMLAIGPRKIVWNRGGGYEMYLADRCTHATVACKPGCPYESERRAEGLLVNLSERRRASDGTSYAIEGWVDTLSLPHTNGWMFEGAEVYSNASEGDFVIDGADAYYVDGADLKRVRKGTAPVTVLATKDERAPIPISKVGPTLYAVKGWSSRTTYLEGEPFSLLAIEDGKARKIYENKGAGCFAANTKVAVVCIDTQLIRVPLSGKPPAPLFTMDQKDRLRMDSPMVALSEDGAIAWSNPSERIVHVRHPPCSTATSPDAESVLGKWNAAHNAHDANALRDVYAPTVVFYGTSLANNECVRRKQSAFAASPDYAQSIRDTKVDGTTVRFVKTSTTKGKSTDYPSALVVRDGRIVEER